MAFVQPRTTSSNCSCSHSGNEGKSKIKSSNKSGFKQSGILSILHSSEPGNTSGVISQNISK